MSKLDLSLIDNQLLDGLEFCTRIYDVFDHIRKQPDGIARLRLRPSNLEKRLIEELIPLARYVQARYREGRRLKVRWLSGSQSYDAVLWSSGELVKRGIAARKVLVEVTTSVHQNNYLARELLHEGGPVFGVKEIKRDKMTKKIVSTPYVNTQGQIASDLATQIIQRLKSKSAKNYPPNTVLIIYCITNSLTFENEWDDAMDEVMTSRAHLAFREVFLVETAMAYTKTFYGQPRK